MQTHMFDESIINILNKKKIHASKINKSQMFRSNCHNTIDENDHLNYGDINIYKDLKESPEWFIKNIKSDKGSGRKSYYQPKTDWAAGFHINAPVASQHEGLNKWNEYAYTRRPLRVDHSEKVAHNYAPDAVPDTLRSAKLPVPFAPRRIRERTIEEKTGRKQVISTNQPHGLVNKDFLNYGHLKTRPRVLYDNGKEINVSSYGPSSNRGMKPDYGERKSQSISSNPSTDISVIENYRKYLTTGNTNRLTHTHIHTPNQRIMSKIKSQHTVMPDESFVDTGRKSQYIMGSWLSNNYERIHAPRRKIRNVQKSNPRQDYIVGQRQYTKSEKKLRNNLIFKDIKEHGLLKK